MKALLFLFHAVLAITFLPLSQCEIQPLNDNLIQQTCRKTTYYALCVSSLKSDPRSSTADVRQLALIMVNIIKAKATAALKQIEVLQQKHRGLRQPLSDCHESYRIILTAEVPEAIEALETGNFKFAEDGANGSASSAENCESNFSAGKSPMHETNKLMHDISVVAASIARILLIG